MASEDIAKIFFHSNIYLNRDASKGLMEMQGKRDARERMREMRRTAVSKKISRIGKRILEATEIVMRAVLFVVIVLAIELAVWGVMYSICRRW